MINFKNRFHGHGSLSFVHRKGETLRSKFLSIKFLNNKFRRHSRVAVVISKKNAKTAVLRNRIRRRIYEVIRLEIPKFKQICDLVIIVNSAEIETLSNSDLTQKLQHLLSEAELI